MNQNKDERNPRGRPPIDPNNSRVQLNTTIATQKWSALKAKAQRERLNPHDYLRRIIDNDLNKSV